MRESTFWARGVSLVWWHQAETTLLTRLSSRSIWRIFIIFATVGVSMRLFTQAQPASYIFHAYDFQSYVLVAQSISESSSPYNTGRYNYGPIWAVIVWLVELISGSDVSFRLGLASVLIFTDVGISLWLKKNGYLLASLFLLLSPISVAISARHLQFDNLAVLFALLSVSKISREKSILITKQDVLACLLLALSLMTKHVFIVFPLWLALRQTSVRKKSLYLFLPPGIFFLSLLPFWLNDSESVFKNVIAYSSLKNAPFLYAIFPDGLADSLITSQLATPIFLLIVGFVGFKLRDISIIQLPLVYMVTIVVFSSAIADQYLAIPIAAALVFFNLGFLMWLGLVAVYLAGNPLTQNWWGFRTIWDWIARDWIPYSAPDWMGLYRDQFVFLFIGWLLLMHGLRKSQNVQGVKTHYQSSSSEKRVVKQIYIGLLVATIALSLPFAFNLFPTRQATVNVYEQYSRNEGVKIDASEPLCAALTKGDEVKIQLSGFLTELYNYQNLFQTSDFNSGMRLEIDDAGQAGLVIGSNGPDGYSVLSIPEKFVPGSFDLSIQIKNSKKVTVAFRNQLTEKVMNGLKPNCDNLIVGYGYDSSRVVKGEVRFLASAPYSVPRFVPRWLDDGLRTGWFRTISFGVFYFILFFAALRLSLANREKDGFVGEGRDHS